MLIFTRRPLEKIMIGNDVVVTVLSAKDGQVSIGIDAPKDIPVDREEIYDLKQKGLPPRSKHENKR